jgi:hypothetical protein
MNNRRNQWLVFISPTPTGGSCMSLKVSENALLKKLKTLDSWSVVRTDFDL